MSFRKGPKSAAICLRIFLFSNLIASTAYGATTPHQMYKVKAECVMIGVAGLAMAVQVYVTLARFCTCFPYDIRIVIGLDGLCAAGWCATIAFLSYCDRVVVYSPRKGDPDAWFECARARYWDSVWTDDGIGKWINLVWCEVVVNGRNRLIGNSAARQQLHALIGLSAVSLLFTIWILLWTIRRYRNLV